MLQSPLLQMQEACSISRSPIVFAVVVEEVVVEEVVEEVVEGSGGRNHHYQKLVAKRHDHTPTHTDTSTACTSLLFSNCLTSLAYCLYFYIFQRKHLQCSAIVLRLLSIPYPD